MLIAKTNEQESAADPNIIGSRLVALAADAIDTFSMAELLTSTTITSSQLPTKERSTEFFQAHASGTMMNKK